MVAGKISRFERIGQLIKSWGQEREEPGICSLLPAIWRTGWREARCRHQGLDGEGVGNRRVPDTGSRRSEGKQPRLSEPAAPASRAR